MIVYVLAMVESRDVTWILGAYTSTEAAMEAWDVWVAEQKVVKGHIYDSYNREITACELDAEANW